MKVGLVQVDGKLPNLALMQICAYHEQQGHEVEWFKGELYADEYDEIYASKIFQFSDMPPLPERTKIGGTGIDFKNVLPTEIAVCPPSYTLYPDCDYHIGFSMKGCRFNCDFCCVPQKEGRPRPNATIDELLINPSATNRLILLDNDFFGNVDRSKGAEYWRPNLERIIELNLKVSFVQGLNIRIITIEQAELLARCRYYSAAFSHRYVTFAWDQYRDERHIMRGIERCVKAGIPTNHMQFFILVGFDTTPDEDMDRITKIKEAGALPYVMPYNRRDPYQAALTRWVNKRQTFTTVAWEDYDVNVKGKNLQRPQEGLFDTTPCDK